MKRLLGASGLSLLLLFSGPRLPAQILPQRIPLHWAAEHSLLEIATLLIESGASVSARDSFGNTPLHLAVDSPEMTELLLKSGAPVNAKNAFENTPLHLAVSNRAVVEILLRHGADVKARNAFGKTPLDYSLWGGTSPSNQAIVKLLIQAGG